MPKDLAIAAGGGVVSAVFYLATVFDAPVALILAYLAFLPLFAVGFGWGAGAATVAAVVATGLVALATSWAGGLVFALAYGVPAAAIVWLALRSRREPNGAVEWYPVGQLVSWLAVYACGSFALLALLEGDSGVREAVAQIEAVMISVLPTETSPQVTMLVSTIAKYLPAIVMSSWLAMALVNMALAHGMLERFARNRRPAPKAASIEVPQWYTVVVVATASLALIARASEWDTVGLIARNAALALLMPYFLVGLAVVHVWARQWSARLVILAGFYLLLVVFGWVAMLALIGLGFMEQWLSLRQRYAGGNSQEDEQ
jgi:hypothetical protein